ncbi:MAG: acetyl-CoA carboxylase biotin carboxyl carrier protein [Treponema sp.]|nr:acetyl-CoA carboxylase biotin carboxyl carrier protein [Treponema sp.]
MNEKMILTIIDKFGSGSIGELDLNDGTTHLILRKQQAQTAAGDSGSAVSGTPGGNSVRLGIAAAEAANAAGANTASGAAGAAGNTAGAEKITSPIVATFYSTPGPDSPPFVKPGAKVKTGQTLCILEAMKMMNHLEAEFNCEIIETHVTSGDLVEYGQPLFTVKRL